MRQITEQSQSILGLLKSLLRPFRWRVVVILLSAVAVSGISLLTPLVQRQLMDDGILQGQWHVIVNCSLLSLTLFLLSQAIEVFQFSCSLYIQKMLSFRLFDSALRHIFRLPISYFNDAGNAQIMNNVTSDIDRIRGIADNLVILTIVQVLKTIGGVIGLMLLHWELGLIVLLGLPVKILMNLYFSKKRASTLAQLIEMYSRYYGWLGDILSNVSIVKLWQARRRSMIQYTNHQRKFMREEFRMEYTGKANDINSHVMDQILQTVLYVIGSTFILNGDLSLGSFFAFTTYSFFVMNTITYLTSVQAHLIEIGPALERHVDFMSLPEEQAGHLPAPSVVEMLSLSNVNLQYDSVTALEDVSLTFKCGEVAAIIGANGSGKSSLIQLLLRMYIPTSGEVYLNGVNIQEICMDEYRGLISVIEQKPQLLNNTVHENINLSGALPKEAIVQAFTKYKMNELLENLSEGIDTHVGVGGLKLSGGERQKITALRALLKPCQILILDEATSNYDIESEHALFDMLLKDKTERITLIITHKYDVLPRVDRVVFLEQGRVAGEGTYQSLKTENERFRTLLTTSASFTPTLENNAK